jgi:hypothetical protein
MLRDELRKEADDLPFLRNGKKGALPKVFGRQTLT